MILWPAPLPPQNYYPEDGSLASLDQRPGYTRAIRWNFCERIPKQEEPFLTVNTGSNDWNYQIKDRR